MSDPSPDHAHTSPMLRYESQKKSPALAAVINFFFPGLGEAYAGHVVGGVIAFIIILIAGAFTFGIIYGLAAIVGIFTGISSVQRYNHRLTAEISGEREAPKAAPVKIEDMTDDEIRAMSSRKTKYNIVAAVLVALIGLVVVVSIVASLSN